MTPTSTGSTRKRRTRLNVGGRNLRVVLDYELKERVYHELAKFVPGRASVESKRTVTEQHGRQVVRGKIPFPDMRIEYDTPDGERARVDIELVASHYRGQHLVEKSPRRIFNLRP